MAVGITGTGTLTGTGTGTFADTDYNRQADDAPEGFLSPANGGNRTHLGATLARARTEGGAQTVKRYQDGRRS